MARTPTLEDVATHSGVSTATVSRALNSPKQVSENTLEKVLKSVETLGYAPNFSARSLVAKKTFTLGAIIPTMADAIFAEAIQAFQARVQEAGYTLLVASSDYDPEIESTEIRSLVARGADGLLLIGFDRDPAIYDFLATQTVPIVVGWAHQSTAAQVSVGFDNALAMKDLATTALQMGHRRIGIISAFQKGNDRARARVEGIIAALQEADLPLPPIVETRYGFDEGAAAFCELLEKDPDVTLAMCGNDVLAAGAIQGAEQMGLYVPRDISITGFDDLGLASIVRPGLTTVRVPHRKLGAAAAESLLALVDGRKAGSVKLRTELRLRASLGLPFRVHFA